MKQLTRMIAAAGLTTALLVGVGLTPSLADSNVILEPVSDTKVIGEFSGLVEAMLLPAHKENELQDRFENLSTDAKTDLVATLQGENPLDALEEGPATATTVPDAISGPQARAALYIVTGSYAVMSSLLGVKIGTWNLKYRYQTNAKTVLKDYTCEGWYSGFAGLWNFSISTNK